jgi:DNA-binding transcriptional MerR regulator
VEKFAIFNLFSTVLMENNYPTNFVCKLTGATNNQLKYWVSIGLVRPVLEGKTFFYSFKDIIKLRVLASLRRNGLSLQKIKHGIRNLSEILPDDNEPLSHLIIRTDGFDMIVAEKGRYFSAITRQNYFQFDTEKIMAEILEFKTSPRQSSMKIAI